MDAIEIQVELTDGSLLENFRGLEELEKRIRQRIKSALLVDARIKLMEPKSIERSTGKAKRVIDLRNQ
jgi:phenylacetate-CoA ligase